ncbi:hypothetical protein HDU76_010558 [Blyttiomyces sp. JEL0837]|nr:hypothetical protein HDU76_010558 [Blyttiomyces sp. JEL0837]
MARSGTGLAATPATSTPRPGPQTPSAATKRSAINIDNTATPTTSHAVEILVPQDPALRPKAKLKKRLADQLHTLPPLTAPAPAPEPAVSVPELVVPAIPTDKNQREMALPRTDIKETIIQQQAEKAAEDAAWDDFALDLEKDLEEHVANEMEEEEEQKEDEGQNESELKDEEEENETDSDDSESEDEEEENEEEGYDNEERE